MDPDHREEAEAHEKLAVAVSVIGERTVEAGVNCLGHIASTAKGTAIYGGALAGIDNLNGKGNGIHRFHHYLGIAVGFIIGADTGSAKITRGIAFENTYVSFTAEKNDLFLCNGNPFDLLSLAKANTSLDAKLCIKSDSDLIKSLIELDRIKDDVRADHLCVLYSEGACFFDHLLTEIREKNLGILKAVPVPTAVEYSFCIYTNVIATV